MRTLHVLLLALLLSACAENSSVQPPTPPFDPFADCGNGDPVSAHDSTFQLWPYPMYTISQLRISPFNGWWAGDYLRFRTSQESTFAMGVFIYDPVNDVPIAQFDDAWGHRWSPDGRSLILIQGFQLYRIDISSLNVLNLTKGYIVQLGSWSSDGKTLYFAHNGAGPTPGMYSMKTDGSEKIFEGSCGTFSQLLNDSTFMGFVIDSIIFLQRGTLIRSARHIPEMDGFPSHRQFDISPMRNRIVIATTARGSVHHPWTNGIWLLDTETWKPRKIRDGQWWNKVYSPTWAPNGNMYASVYCRSDSSKMVWEFDLDGNPIRRITHKTMKVW
jgi:hypothetical protein